MRRGLRKSANPGASAATILANLVKETNSSVARLGRGEYTLKETIEEASESNIDTKLYEEEATEAGALQAFGMFWQREQVLWNGKAKLLGRQGLGATNVNFAEQVGVYLLHDRERVIYVGRAADTLFARLKFHTTDRLAGRWDRFSWFGLRSVRSEGGLSEPSVAWTHTVVIETLEALLIESLEPPLNRKRGDNFSGAEYIQVSDPDIERKRQQKWLADIATKVESGL